MEINFIRITSDFICRENGLSIVSTPWKHKGYYKLYAKNNPYMQLVKKDIDDAISSSYSYKGFKTKLETQGYLISYNGNTGFIISRNNSYKIIRPQELFGENYTKEKILDRIENKTHNKLYIPKKKYKMTIEEYKKLKQKQREYQLGKLPLFYIVICLLLKIDPLPQRIELNNYKLPITREMKIAIKHLNSLSEQTILLAENKITHEIGDLKVLINKTNKDIVNCFEIENRTILLKNQLEIEKTKEMIKEKKKDKSRIR